MTYESPEAHELRTMPDAFMKVAPQRSAYAPIKRNKPMIDNNEKGYWEMTEDEYIAYKRKQEAEQDAYLAAHGIY